MHDPSGSGDTCNDAKRAVTQKWLSQEKIRFRQDPEDTSQQCIIDSWGQPASASEKNTVNYYFVQTKGIATDSFLFVGSSWNCPDYKTFVLHISSFPFEEIRGAVNYLGNNHGATARSVDLKLFFRDTFEHKYTKYTPVINADDSSSVLINSVILDLFAWTNWRMSVDSNYWYLQLIFIQSFSVEV